MAKKAMIEREVKREKLVAQYATKRAALKEIASNQDLQPLSADRSPQGVLPQVENVAYQAAGPGLEWSDPRHGQVKLVRRSYHERSYR